MRREEPIRFPIPRDLHRQSNAVAQLSPSQLVPLSVAELHSPVEAE